MFQLDHLGAKVSARPLVLPQIEGQLTFLVKLDRNRKSFVGFPESSLFFERNPLQNRWRACPRSHLWEFELAQCAHMFGLFRSSPLEHSSPRCAKANECKTTFDPFSIMSCDQSTLALGRLFLLTAPGGVVSSVPSTNGGGLRLGLAPFLDVFFRSRKQRAR